MKPETAERIRKAMNDIDNIPLRGNSPKETEERFATIEILSMVARSFLLTHIPLDTPASSDHPDAAPVHLDYYLQDIFGHGKDMRLLVDFIDRANPAMLASLTSSLPQAAAEGAERTRI